jgi:hypothetical protein
MFMSEPSRPNLKIEVMGINCFSARVIRQVLRFRETIVDFKLTARHPRLPEDKWAAVCSNAKTTMVSAVYVNADHSECLLGDVDHLNRGINSVH